MWDEFALVAAASFALGSMAYVYTLRGNVQYDTLRQYLRKGWPIFAPINCLLYLASRPRARGAILDPDRYPELDALRDNWEVIRDEAVALHRARHLEAACQPDSNAYYDIGFRTFYKYGWRKFYLNWYGTTQPSALEHCPRTVALLDGMRSVNGAMFSMLPSGGQLTRHSDPAACSLRYHLGLATPNDDACFINIDGNAHSWRDGEVLIFDETYLHYARNDCGSDRLILMCDIDRPVSFIGWPINAFYKWLMRQTLVPNMAGDRRGLANRVFAGIAPQLKRSKQLKASNYRAYLALKYSVNTLLLLLAAALAWGAIKLVLAFTGLG